MTTVVQTQQQLQAVYDGIARAWSRTNWRPVLVKELELLRIEHKKYFDTNTGPDGEKWPELARSTVQRKGHSTILVDKGHLRRQLTSTGTGVRVAVDEPAGRGVVFGTDLPYSVFHDKRSGSRPARRHVGVDASYVDRFGNRCLVHALEALKQDG